MKKERIISLVVIGLYIISMNFFYVGTRNMDNGFNMALLTEWEYETFVNQEVRNARNTYLSGVKFVSLSFAGFMLAFLLLLFSDRLQL